MHKKSDLALALKKHALDSFIIYYSDIRVRTLVHEKNRLEFPNLSSHSFNYDKLRVEDGVAIEIKSLDKILNRFEKC